MRARSGKDDVLAALEGGGGGAGVCAGTGVSSRTGAASSAGAGGLVSVLGVAGSTVWLAGIVPDDATTGAARDSRLRGAGFATGTGAGATEGAGATAGAASATSLAVNTIAGGFSSGLPNHGIRLSQPNVVDAAANMCTTAESANPSAKRRRNTGPGQNGEASVTSGAEWEG